MSVSKLDHQPDLLSRGLVPETFCLWKIDALICHKAHVGVKQRVIPADKKNNFNIISLDSFVVVFSGLMDSVA